MTDFALSLTTQLRPTKKFKVDGVPYELLGIDHISDTEESEVMALFARYGVLNDELDRTTNVTKGTDLADRMKATRFLILTKLTTVPKEVVTKLPLSAQVKLMEAIEAEVDADDDGSEAEAAAEAATDAEVAGAREG